MSTGAISPFRPTGTVALSASTATASTQLVGGGESVVVTNTAASLAYVRFGGDASVTASSSDMPVLQGSRVVLSVNPLITYVSAVLVNGSGSILFTRGDGSIV